MYNNNNNKNNNDNIPNGFNNMMGGNPFGNPMMGNPFGNPMMMNPMMGNQMMMNPMMVNQMMMQQQQQFYQTMMSQFEKKVEELKEELQDKTFKQPKKQLPRLIYSEEDIEEEIVQPKHIQIVKKSNIKSKKQNNSVKSNYNNNIIDIDDMIDNEPIIKLIKHKSKPISKNHKKKTIKDAEQYVEQYVEDIDENTVVISNNDPIIDDLTINFKKVVNQDKMIDKGNNYWFKQENDDSNVIMYIKPLKNGEAHFDKVNYPKELYITYMINGDISNKYAIDISDYTLEVQKSVIEHNKQIEQIGLETPGKAMIYARTSTKNDISIDTQRVECFKYAKDNNIALNNFGFQYDQLSARHMNNLDHELGCWIKHVENNSDLIIYSVDRLSRHLGKGIMFLEEMKSRNITVHFILEQIKYNNLTNHAQLDMVYECLRKAENVSNLTSEKVQRSINKRKAEGHVFGQAPYGYKNIKVNDVRKRVEDNQEQENITMIIDKYNNIKSNIENNDYNLATICRHITEYLRKKNILYIGGRYFQDKHVKRIIKNYLQDSNNEIEVNE